MMRFLAARARPWPLLVWPSACGYKANLKFCITLDIVHGMVFNSAHMHHVWTSCSMVGLHTLSAIRYSAALLYPANPACSCRSDMICSTIGLLSVLPEEALVSYAV